MYAEVIALLKAGGQLRRELTIGATTFKIVSGTVIKTFPLKLLTKLVRKGIVEITSVESFHSVYKLRRYDAH